MTEYKTLDEFIAESEAYRKTLRGRWGIFWHNRVMSIFRAPKRFYYEIKYFIQRGKKGYSDRDLWSADTYLARIIAGILNDYANSKHGVGPYYMEDGLTVDQAFKNLQKEYREKAKLFAEYGKNGMALNKEWKQEFGGLLDKELTNLLKWLVKVYPELWD